MAKVSKKRVVKKSTARAVRTVTQKPTEAQLQEAAYFRWLNRGSEHGGEVQDWVEAEKDLSDRN